MELPLILVTNDDGIESKGLWAAAEALLPLGEILVVAPDRQWSGGGRSMPPDVTGRITPASRQVNGTQVTAFALDASPALAVVHGVTELASRRPSLVVSGINFGANLGIEVTISGTVGAALEAGAFEIPAIAVSLEMDLAYHLTGDASANYTAAKAFTQHFARHLLNHMLPHDVDALNINVPSDATPDTRWQLTHLSCRRHFVPTPPDRVNDKGRPGYKLMDDPRQAEMDSDIQALLMGRVVTVTPLSLDLTSRVDWNLMNPWLRGESPAYMDMLGLAAFFNCPPPDLRLYSQLADLAGEGDGRWQID
jgi:5'-nucleotidase